MIKLVKKIFSKLIAIFKSSHQKGNEVNKCNIAIIQASRCEKWFKDNGDETLRLNYPLTENSIVFDVGGYFGEFARDIYCKYNSTVLVFEPVPEFYNKIVDRFINNIKVQVFNFGLGSNNYKTQINLDENSSSIYISGNNSIEIEIKSFNDFIKERNISTIDLVKINIEGSEYDLLESIIESGNISKISNIQVQFHDFIIENALERMRSIQNKLSLTHQVTYQYEFVWENWQLKENN
jgi:FkbM family methyltransferase